MELIDNNKGKDSQAKALRKEYKLSRKSTIANTESDIEFDLSQRLAGCLAKIESDINEIPKLVRAYKAVIDYEKGQEDNIRGPIIDLCNLLEDIANETSHLINKAKD